MRPHFLRLNSRRDIRMRKGSLTKLQMAFVYRSNAKRYNNLGIEETKLLREPGKHLDSAASVPVRYCG